ncbi:sulfur carrier protein ThiS adenylyltransferase ThiF [Victivallis vadensis]|uniref:Sulfur carrier protein ThiS adenylyltransferase n=1 Tax=Victivallis vadensis TaxID=172901 RepID=A0A2U1B9V1_9BACT|nr:sulfur carrier protein ThiS adenylyltransferase ThiF [Victivallis vadensis]PVY45436.1 sulfur carrier protein ThiS adenylyltransferase [Victivallis vadensis]
MAFNPYLGAAERARIEAARVGVAGAGGLGSNCLAHLVRCGVRRFVIADFDTVSESNLNRQFFFADQLGMPKVEAVAANLRRINSALELELYPERVTAENAVRRFGSCDVTVEAFDDPDAKTMLIRALLPLGKPVVAASGIAGWGRSNTMRVQRIGQRLYMAGDRATGISEETPPHSPRVGIAAAQQANTVMALILGVEI